MKENKHNIWDKKKTLLFRCEDFNDYNPLDWKNAPRTRLGLLLLLLQVHHSHFSSHSQVISLGKGKRLYKEKRLKREC
jgi:hypothetical protein